MAFVGPKLDVVGTAEIAKMLSVTPQRVHQLTGEAGFPAPAAKLKCGRIWHTAEVEAWIADTGTVRPPKSLSPDKGVPRRDRNRPEDDPWDADAVRFLRSTELGQEQNWQYDELFGCLRQRPSLVIPPERDEEARHLTWEYGVTCRPDPGGETIHFFRSDAGRPHYPESARERRTWLRQGFPPLPPR